MKSDREIEAEELMKKLINAFINRKENKDIKKDIKEKRAKVIPVQLDDDMQLKGSLAVQEVLAKNNFNDYQGNPIQANRNVMGMSDKGDVVFLNEAGKVVNGGFHVVRIHFKKDRVSLEHGTPEKRKFSKVYSYGEIYNFQKDFMKWLKKVEKKLK